MLEIGKGFSTTQVLWEYYWNRDETVLATSSENNEYTLLDILIQVPQNERKLFLARGYTWKHGAEEIAFLKRYECVLSFTQTTHPAIRLFQLSKNITPQVNFSSNNTTTSDSRMSV